jgi:hypothetical protein
VGWIERLMALKDALCKDEKLNGRFRDECLNDNVFKSLAEVRQIIEQWRLDCHQTSSQRSYPQ